jgi:hypothetical protein
MNTRMRTAVLCALIFASLFIMLALTSAVEAARW